MCERSQLAVLPAPHRLSCRIFAFDMGWGPRIWVLQLPPAQDLDGGCKISYPWTCGCTCASAEAEHRAGYQTAGFHRPLQQVSTATGVSMSSIAFSHCQPALCVSNLADVLLVSHFELLVSVICSTFRINSSATRSRCFIDFQAISLSMRLFWMIFRRNADNAYCPPG